MGVFGDLRHGDTVPDKLENVRIDRWEQAWLMWEAPGGFPDKHSPTVSHRTQGHGTARPALWGGGSGRTPVWAALVGSVLGWGAPRGAPAVLGQDQHTFFLGPFFFPAVAPDLPTWPESLLCPAVSRGVPHVEGQS